MINQNKLVVSRTEPIKLFLVDDDAVFLKLLEAQFLEHADFAIETFGPRRIGRQGDL